MTTRQHTEKDIDKIRYLRETEDLTLEELAERFGVSKATIRRYLEERMDDPRHTEGVLHCNLRPDIDEYGDEVSEEE